MAFTTYVSDFFLPNAVNFQPWATTRTHALHDEKLKFFIFPRVLRDCESPKAHRQTHTSRRNNTRSFSYDVSPVRSAAVTRSFTDLLEDASFTRVCDDVRALFVARFVRRDVTAWTRFKRHFVPIRAFCFFLTRADSTHCFRRTFLFFLNFHPFPQRTRNALGGTTAVGVTPLNGC